MAVGSRRGGFAARFVLCCSALLAVGLLGAGTAAAAPANNDFANAQLLSGTATSAGGTNVEANKETGEPNHADESGGASVWYTWTAPNSGTYQVNTCGSNFDTVLAVYTGSAVDSLTTIAANDESPSCNEQSVLVFQAVSGTTYHIAVDGYSGGGWFPPDTGNVGIVVQRINSAPANNSFASAQVLQSRTENLVQGSNVLATKQTGEPNHAGDNGGASVWYSWVAPTSGWMRIDICNSDYYSLLAVYTGSAVNSLTEIASTARYVGCKLEFNAVQGITYRIAVDGYSIQGTKPAEIGYFNLQTHLIQPPANDNFVAAQVISSSSARVLGSNVDATVEAGEPEHFDGGPWASVWYSWTAPASGQATFDTCPSDFDTVLAVYRGNAVNALTLVADNDDACDLGSRVSFPAVSGTTYRIAVDGLIENGQVDLGVKLVQTPPPAPVKTAPQSNATPDKSAPKSKIKKMKVDSEHGKAKVTFGSSEAGSKFKCKLDRKAYKSCHSPKIFRHLDAGKHKVKVRATDAAGNTDPTPAVKRFKIEG